MECNELKARLEKVVASLEEHNQKIIGAIETDLKRNLQHGIIVITGRFILF